MRRPAALVLAALLTLPLVAPVSAADPSGQPDPVAPSAEPSAPPEPSLEPTTEPTPDSTPEPTPEATPPPDPTTAMPTAPPPPSAKTAKPAPAQPAPAADEEPELDAQGRPIATGRYIVMLDTTADTTKVMTRHRQREGMKAERSFKHAFRGFTAKLDKLQRQALLADPSVAAVVPDEVISITAQTMPTGVSRVAAPSSSVANINGADDRVDADVAIVDTGIWRHHDLNVAGGYNCSSTNRSAWSDPHGHGTHVAGTVGAKDNTVGVVGVAPGVRLWAVRILNSSGSGLLSWYVCGLDWILAQRDPNDPARPLIEAVNMSVAKSGRDATDCGVSIRDILHQAICRLYNSGITVVAAAANERTSAARYVPAAYNQVITVSALADTDGRPGGLGGRRCYSWGGYDRDETFADFSNYGSDIDIIAPGKCILSTKPGPSYGYSSGTSMAAPAVTGAVALYKASRPLATPAEVREALRYLGNFGWFTSSDPDQYHEPLLGVSRIRSLGSFSLSAPTTVTIGSNGGAGTVPVTVSRSSSFFERVRFRIDSVPSGWSASMVTPSLFGWTANAASVRVTVPDDAQPGTYHLQVSGSNWGRSRSATLTVRVAADIPTAYAPTASVLSGASLGRTSSGTNTVALKASWAAATDRSDTIVRYQVERSTNGGAYGSTITTTASTRSAAFSGLSFGSTYRFRVRAQDSDGSWSPWATAGATVTPLAVSDGSSLVTYRGRWLHYNSTLATNSWHMSSAVTGATARLRFTGRGIAFIAPTNATRGKAYIYLDGTLRATIDLRSTTTIYRRAMYVGNWSTSGTHTIEVKVAGTGRTVSVDGFVILR
jgi:subtilisin family serine protease